MKYCDKEGSKAQDLWLSRFALLVGRGGLRSELTAVVPGGYSERWPRAAALVGSSCGCEDFV